MGIRGASDGRGAGEAGRAKTGELPGLGLPLVGIELRAVAQDRIFSRTILAMRVRAAIIVILICALIVPPSVGQTRCPANRPHTLYSRLAADLENDGKPINVQSPDGKNSVTGVVVEDPKAPDGLVVRYTIHTGDAQFVTSLDGWGAEISWSPDFSAFAVTQTEGGGGIGYRVYVFYAGPSGVRKVDVSRIIEAATGFSSQCEVKVLPNTAVITWLSPRRLLVGAETVPVSICKCDGSFEAYEVSLPDVKIEKRYSQQEAKKKFWNQLGCELRDADDRCAVAKPAAMN